MEVAAAAVTVVMEASGWVWAWAATARASLTDRRARGQAAGSAVPPGEEGTATPAARKDPRGNPAVVGVHSCPTRILSRRLLCAHRGQMGTRGLRYRRCLGDRQC